MEVRLSDHLFRWACRRCIAEYGETPDNCGPWGPDPTNDPAGHHARVVAEEQHHNEHWHTPAFFRAMTTGGLA